MSQIYRMEISMGSLEVYENRIVIIHKVPLGGTYERIIPLKSIMAIQFEAGEKSKGGYIQFIVPGCNSFNISSATDTAKDYNAISFSKAERETAIQIKDYIVNKIV